MPRKERKKLKAERNQIESTFGQGKNEDKLNKVRARLKDTSESWIAGIFFIMNSNLSYKPFMLLIINTLVWLHRRGMSNSKKLQIFLVNLTSFFYHNFFQILRENQYGGLGCS